MSSICPPQECVKTGQFQCRNALFPTVLKSQRPLWNMTGIQMPLCLSSGANVWRAREGTLAAAQNPQWPYAEEVEEHLPSASRLTEGQRGRKLRLAISGRGSGCRARKSTQKYEPREFWKRRCQVGNTTGGRGRRDGGPWATLTYRVYIYFYIYMGGVWNSFRTKSQFDFVVLNYQNGGQKPEI